MAGWIGALSLTACAHELSIGADACARGASCEVQHLAVAESALQVRSQGSALEPIWKASQLRLESDAVVEVDRHSELASTPDGTLWVFTPANTQLNVMRLDLDAKVMGQLNVAAPAGATEREDFVPHLAALHSHARGPALGVQWPNCDGDTCGPPLSELLVFEAGAQQPRRLLPFPDQPRTDDTLRSVHRSADGEALLITSAYTADVRKLDLAGRTVWRSSLALDQFGELPNTKTRRSVADLFRSGAISPSGDLVCGIDVTLASRDGWSWSSFPSGMLHIAQDGTRSARLYEGWQSRLTIPTGEAWEAHPHAMLAFDTRGRVLVTYRLRDGDLLVLRATDSSAESFRILREDYADLSLHDIAVDPAGTLYIASEGGGRAAGSEIGLLCRVPEEGDPACFSLPELAFHIEAPAPGVVFALLNRTQELARFDLD